MARSLLAIAVSVLAALASGGAEPPAANAKLLGAWALHGKDKLRWEVFADGSVTGSVDDKRVVHPPTSRLYPSVSYTMGEVNDEGVAEVTFTVRASDKPGDVGEYKAKVEFTRAGRPTVRYTATPADPTRFPPPFSEGKKLYRPADVTR